MKKKKCSTKMMWIEVRRTSQTESESHVRGDKTCNGGCPIERWRPFNSNSSQNLPSDSAPPVRTVCQMTKMSLAWVDWRHCMSIVVLDWWKITRLRFNDGTDFDFMISAQMMRFRNELCRLLICWLWHFCHRTTYRGITIVCGMWYIGIKFSGHWNHKIFSQNSLFIKYFFKNFTLWIF